MIVTRKQVGLALAIVIALGIARPIYEGYRVWCFQRVRLGQTRSDVLAIVGPPTSTSMTQCLAEENCEDGSCWLYRQKIFENLVVHFDLQGHVSCVDIYRPEIRVHG